ELKAQRAFSPQNDSLWDRAEPPDPSPAAWAVVRRGIEAGLNQLPLPNPSPQRRGASNSHFPRREGGWGVRFLLGGLSVAAAAVAWLALRPATPQPGGVVQVPTPTAIEFAPAPRAVLPVPGSEL